MTRQFVRIFLFIVKAHVLHLATKKFQMNDLDDNSPNNRTFGDEFLACSDIQRSGIFVKAILGTLFVSILMTLR